MGFIVAIERPTGDHVVIEAHEVIHGAGGHYNGHCGHIATDGRVIRATVKRTHPETPGVFLLARLYNVPVCVYHVHVMATPEPNRSFFYCATIQQLRWVDLAASRDPHRRPLSFAQLVHWRHASWLMATDTHRIHAVRVSDPKTKVGQHTPIPVDVRRMINEMKMTDSKLIAFDYDDNNVLIGDWLSHANVAVPSKDDLLPTCHGRKLVAHGDFCGQAFPENHKWLSWRNGEKAKLPDFADRILTPCDQWKTAPSQLALNPKYLGDVATMGNSIIFRGPDGSRPVIIEPNVHPSVADEHGWFAVIMQMAAMHPVFAELEESEVRVKI